MRVTVAVGVLMREATMLVEFGCADLTWPWVGTIITNNKVHSECMLCAGIKRQHQLTMDLFIVRQAGRHELAG